MVLKAVEKYAELEPDLVLMDITMPEMDGIQALKKIKRKQMLTLLLLCVQLWVSRLWLLNQFSLEQKISLLSLSRQTELLKLLRKVVG